MREELPSRTIVSFFAALGEAAALLDAEPTGQPQSHTKLAGSDATGYAVAFEAAAAAPFLGNRIEGDGEEKGRDGDSADKELALHGGEGIACANQK